MSTEKENSKDESQIEEDQLMLEALGADPSATDAVEIPLEDLMVKRWKYWLNNGQKEEDLSFLMTEYATPNFLKVPELNQEIILLPLPKHVVDRDNHFKEEQELISAAIVHAGAMATVIAENIHLYQDKIGYKMIAMIQEQVQLLTHAFLEKSIARKIFILPSIKDPKRKSILEAQSADEFLFGADLPEKLKALDTVLQASNKLGSAFKPVKRTSSFLEQRDNHPKRRGRPWSGQGSQRGRSIFQGQRRYRGGNQRSRGQERNQYQPFQNNQSVQK